MSNMKPVHEHDCESCIYLGTVKDGEDTVDCYVCKEHAISSNGCIIGRHGVDGEYRTADSAYLDNAELFPYLGKWFMFAVIQMARKGLLDLAPKNNSTCRECSKTNVFGHNYCETHLQ